MDLSSHLLHKCIIHAALHMHLIDSSNEPHIAQLFDVKCHCVSHLRAVFDVVSFVETKVA